MKRKNVVQGMLRIAGYHGDNAEMTSIYLTNKIKLTDAKAEFLIGINQRKAGMACHCERCKTKCAQGVTP